MSTQDFAHEVKSWLKQQGRNPQWLADQCGTKISVVYSWFSTRGFPEDQKQRIIDMMRPDDSTSMIRVPFTDQQLKNTNEAATQTGYANDIQAYCQKAIETQVELDLQRKAVIDLPMPTNKVAEEPGEIREMPEQKQGTSYQKTRRAGNGGHG